MALTLDPSQERQLDLLKIACCMAWVDGDVSPEEKRLITQLVARYFPPIEGDQGIEDASAQLVAWCMDLSVLDTVVPRLTCIEDRQLALKFAYMVARISKRSDDPNVINAEEKKAYRQLVTALGLSDEQVRETEWAANQELDAKKGILGLFDAFFDGLGAWPNTGIAESNPMLWL